MDSGIRAARGQPRRWLITGASGQLGGYLLDEFVRADSEGERDFITAWSGRTTGMRGAVAMVPVDLASERAIDSAFTSADPTIVVHAAAISRIDACRDDPERARAVNVLATRRLADRSADCGCRFLYVSTDLVFDGEKGDYAESDAARPLSLYGRTKLEGEHASSRAPDSLTLRVSLLYGPGLHRRGDTMFERQYGMLREGRTCDAFDDEWRTPLDLATAASAILAAARGGARGLLHLGGPERLSRFEMACELARSLGLPESRVARSSAAGRFSEPRPRDTSLDSRRWRALFPDHAWPTMRESLRRLSATDRG